MNLSRWDEAFDLSCTVSTSGTAWRVYTLFLVFRLDVFWNFILYPNQRFLSKCPRSWPLKWTSIITTWSYHATISNIWIHKCRFFIANERSVPIIYILVIWHLNRCCILFIRLARWNMSEIKSFCCSIRNSFLLILEILTWMTRWRGHSTTLRFGWISSWGISLHL